MRILLVSESYPPVVSGVSTVVASYAQMLRRLHHSVCVITTNNTHVSCVTKTKGITVHRIKSTKNYLRPGSSIAVPSKKEIKAIIEKERPDIIHVHTIATLSFSVQHIAKRMNIPVVATVHGIPPWLLTYIPIPKVFLFPLEYILWIILKQHLNRIVHVTTPSLYVKQELIKHGVTTACSVLPMWIVPPRQETKRNRLKNFHCNPSTKYYCFIGRLDPDKNLPFLIRAWIRFQKQHPGAAKRRLLVIGSGTQESFLRRLATYDLTHSIIFLGTYEEKELSYVYQNCHFFCMPALYETQSIVTLQAIAHKKIAILARSGALTEIRKRYPKQVFLYNPNIQDDLVRCFGEVASTSTSIIQPKPNMAFYSQQKIRNQLIQLYTTIIKAPLPT
jgi:glycosyltransferase involved in cell wall biosynthesis